LVSESIASQTSGLAYVKIARIRRLLKRKVGSLHKNGEELERPDRNRERARSGADRKTNRAKGEKKKKGRRRKEEWLVVISKDAGEKGCPICREKGEKNSGSGLGRAE